MSGGIPGEKISELKALLDRELRRKDIYSEIRRTIASFVSRDAEEEEEGETQKSETPSDRVVRIFRERGLLDDLIASMGTKLASSRPGSGAAAASFSAAQLAARKNKMFLHLKFLGGKAFLEYEKKASSISTKRLQAYVAFDRQRFRTNVVAATPNPSFDDDVLIELPTTDPLDLLTMEAIPIQIVVVEVGDSSNRFVGGHLLEWRRVLKSGLVGITLELGGGRFDFAKGVLELRLELHPRPETRILEKQLTSQLQLELASRKRLKQEFYLYVQRWYQEYLQARPDLKTRLVKIFADTEYGETLPVTSFVSPLRNTARVVNSPANAARYVALIPEEVSGASGGGRGAPTKDLWWLPHTFIAKKRGTVEDHALLLCSLLLGFGMDAYVGVGYVGDDASMWVLTRGSGERISFWDPLRGGRRLASEVTNSATVDSVFNHTSFYANLQRSSEVRQCSFEFENERLWKAMSPTKIRMVRRVPSLSLSPPTADSISQAVRLERRIRARVEKHRRDLGWSTEWDTEMDHVLAPALACYEQQSSTGQTARVGLLDFQDSVRRTVKEGHTFKGYPRQVNSLNVETILGIWKKNRASLDILECVGDSVRFGVRAMVVPQADDVCCVWVFIAVQFQPV